MQIKLYSQTKRILKLAAPVTLNSMSNVVIMACVMLMIARLGHNALAAAALVNSTFIMLFVICSAALTAIGILVVRYHNAKEADKISAIAHSSFVVACLLGIPLTILMWNMGDLLILFHQNPKLVAMAIPYFHAICFGLIAMFWSVVLQQLYIGLNKPKTALIYGLLRIPVVLILSYICIFGKLHFPALGLAGFAVAQTVSAWLLLCAYMFYVKYDASVAHLNLLCFVKKVNWQQCKQLLSVGIPIGLQFGGEVAAMTVATYFMGWMGAQALAAQQIVSQYMMLFFMVVLGLSQATSIITSEAVSLKNYPEIKIALFCAIGIGLIICLMVAGFYLLFPSWLVSIFLNIRQVQNLPVLHLSITLFAIAALFQLIDSVRNITAGALRGLHDSKYSMLVGLMTIWLIALPTSYFFGFILNLGPGGLRFGFIIGFFVCTIMMLRRFFQNLKMLK